MMHVVAAVAAGLLERVWPSTVPAPHDYDVPVQDVEEEVWEPTVGPLVARAAQLGQKYETFDSSSDSTPAGGLDPAAGVSPPNPAAGLPSAAWLAPAVMEILAEHDYRFGYDTNCDCGTPGIFDEFDWREHVGPLIAEHVLTCLKSFQSK